MRPNRKMILGAVALGATVAFSSLAIVRAEHSPPPKGKNSFTCSNGTACLQAKSTGGSTPAFSATSTAGISNSAVVGTASAGTGVFGTGAQAGVTGYSANDFGVEGFTGSSGENGVYGESDAYGNGQANSGVYGFQASGSPGVVGTSASGPGVVGAGASGYGVEGDSTGNAGVYGYSQQGGGNGVYGENDVGGAVGVFGYTQTGNGILGDSEGSTGFAVAGQTAGGSAYLFGVENFTNFDECVIDPDANLSCSGKIMGGVLAQRHRNSSGQRVLAYASQSASATIEDVGKARLFNGVANVMIPEDFASVIDRGTEYYVFLTPMGDTRGLYVSMETASGFQVREAMRGRSDIAFDYRIVAKPIDASDDRLPPAPRTKRMHVTARLAQPHIIAPGRPARLRLPVLAGFNR